MSQQVILNGKPLDFDNPSSLELGAGPRRTPVTTVNGAELFGVAINGYTYPPAIPGTILYYPGLPAQGAKVWNRAAGGSACDGTINGAVWVRLPSGLWVLKDDGADDYTSCGNAAAINVTVNFSVLVWAKVTAPDADYESVFAKWDTDGKRSWTIHGGTSSDDRQAVFFGVSADGGTTSYKHRMTAAKWLNGLWHLFGFTFADDTLLAYMDGVNVALSGTNDTVHSVYQSAVNTTIGAEYVMGTIGRFSTMQWGHARIVSRVIPATEWADINRRERPLLYGA